MGRQVEASRGGADVVEALYKEFENDSDIAGFNIPLVIADARAAKLNLQKLLEEIPKMEISMQLSCQA